jgi:hypothetical protein
MIRRRRPVSNSSRLAQRGESNLPPKKSKALLITVITITVIVVIVTTVLLIYFLWWRKRGQGPLYCNTSADCDTGLVCKTGIHTCVECLSDANCSGTRPICSTTTDTCIPGCKTSADCADPTPLCNTEKKVCVECFANVDCEGVAETPFCETEGQTCVECLENTDCIAPETCFVNVCCDVNSALTFTITSVTPTSGDDCDIVFEATFSQDLETIETRFILYRGDYPNHTLLDQTPPLTLVNGTNTINSSEFEGGTILFANVSYGCMLQTTGICGDEPFTSFFVIDDSIIRTSVCAAPTVLFTAATEFTRTVIITVDESNIVLGLVLKLTNSEYENDYTFIFRDNVGVAGFTGATYYFMVPEGPTITVGTTCSAWYFRDHGDSCFGTPVKFDTTFQ